MSYTPVKIDGIGTRKSGTESAITASNPAELANTARPKKFVRLFNTQGSAVAKGDAVCLDINSTEPANGYGNHFVLADVDAVATICPLGIAAEAIADGESGLIQVFGYCDFAKTVSASAAPGDALGVNTAVGQLSIRANDNGTTVAIHIADSATGTGNADSKVFLVNPLNY